MYFKDFIELQKVYAIKSITLDNQGEHSLQSLTIIFNNEWRLTTSIWQSCCENRYLHTEDDLNYFHNSFLLDIEQRDTSTCEEVLTSSPAFTAVCGRCNATRPGHSFLETVKSEDDDEIEIERSLTVSFLDF